MGDDGRFLIVWRDESRAEIHGQLFDPNAAPSGSELQVSDPSVNEARLPAASLAGDGSSYLVLYEAEDSDGIGVFASWIPLP